MRCSATEACRGRQIRRRFDADNIAAQVAFFGGQNRLDVHGSLPGSCARAYDIPAPTVVTGATILPATGSVKTISCDCTALMLRCIEVVNSLEIGLGIEPGKQHRPARKPPIWACQATTWSLPANGSEPRPNNRLMPNHTARKTSTRGSLQHADERHRRHVIVAALVAAAENQRAAALKRKAHRRRHGAGNRRRRADHRRQFAGMGEQMLPRAGRRRHRERRPESAPCRSGAPPRCRTAAATPH